MTYLIAALVLLGVFAAVYTKLFDKDGDAAAASAQPSATCATCTGTDTRCEQDCMMEAATKEIVYYDDEELDSYRGRPADSYSDNEVEAFADVLYTLRAEEVADWSRSLILRGINLPNALKDEVIMMIESR